MECDRLQGVEYAFKHPLIQEVTYDSLLAARREELHLQVGRAVEAALGAQVPGYHAMLAFHFSLGRDLERAEKYLFEAGSEAAQSAASNEALRFFQEASKLYFERHGEGGDPRKKATLERSVALAMYNRGLVGEAIAHFDAALEYLGERVTKNPLLLNLRFLRDVSAVLADLYLKVRVRSRPAASAEQREIIDVMFRRGESQSTADPMRFVFDAVATIRKLSKVDPSTVPGAGGMYAGAVGIFSYSGVSFGVSRRFLALARRVGSATSEQDQPLFYRFARFLHHFLEGDWSAEHEIEEAVLEEGLREGRLFEVTSYLGLAAEKALRQGDFPTAGARIQLLDKIWELYEYEPAKLGRYALPFMLRLEQRRLREVGEAADVYIQESPQELLHLAGLGYKARAQLLDGERDDAEATLARADEIVKKVGSPIPYHRSSYLVARLCADLISLEAAAAAGDRGESRRLDRRSRRSGRAALRIVPKVSHWGPEAFRLAGRRAWLTGREAEAVRWWERSLAAGRHLGMRPEIARTYHEAGLRFAESRRARELEGRDAAACLEEARMTFAALDLGWDLARLESSSPP